MIKKNLLFWEHRLNLDVIPAKAGIQRRPTALDAEHQNATRTNQLICGILPLRGKWRLVRHWIPAFAGMTPLGWLHA